MRNPLVFSAIIAGIVVPSTAILAAPKGDTLTIAVYGDAPYGTTPTDTAQLAATPAFIQSINADQDVRLVLHVGDIHSGKQFCTQAYDLDVFDLWTAFADPLV